MKRLSYTIDKQDLVINTNEAFVQFAMDNNAPQLPKNVLGKPIWNFLGQKDVKSLYKNIFDAVRSTKKAVDITFRCDSPKFIRFMKMEITPLSNQNLEIATEQVREVPRKQMLRREVFLKGINNKIDMCSHCNKIHIKSIDEWKETQEALDNKMVSSNFFVNYKVCHDCVIDLKNIAKSLSMN